MSIRRAQDERIEGTPDGVNAITEIVDVPDAPTIGTATAGAVSASITFTPSATGGTVTTYTATSTPGSITGTSSSSPVTVSGLTAGTAYTFKIKGSNSTGTGAESSASNSVTPTNPNTLTYKTVIANVGFADETSNEGHNDIDSGVWLSLAPITSITLSCPNATSWAQYSKASLYGILGTGSSASFDSIATVDVGSGTTPTIQFNNIPNTYKDLQIRAVLRTNRSGSNGDAITMRFNGDSGANYAGHRLEFVGSAENAYNEPNATGITINRITGAAANSKSFGLALINIQNAN